MIFMLLVVVGIGFNVDVQACSCVRQPDDERAAVSAALERADLVFLGRIEGAENYNAKEYGEEIQYQRTAFLILQSWKGERANRVYVESPVTCCLCGYPFPKSGVFLVYAYFSEKNGYYTTSSCSRTKPIDEADEEIKLLDEVSIKDSRTRRSSRSREERAPTER
jgi:hypothetical protein